MPASTPRMTVILIAPYGVEVLQNILSCLRVQTIADQLQVVVVTSEEDKGVADFSKLHSYKILRRTSFRSGGAAKAQAIRSSDAPVVAFAEDHCFPESGWAEALLEAHKSEHAAVSPWMGAANPKRCWSMASFFNFLPSNSEERELRLSLPTHNASYKKRLLLEFGDHLDELLEMETAKLVPDLLSRGCTILHEPAARVWHVNVETAYAFFLEQFYSGRQYGAIRSLSWPLWRRLVYAGGSVLIPALRLLRQGSDLRNKIEKKHRIAVFTGFLINAAGESWGYLFGLGETSFVRLDLECWRERHILDPFSIFEIVPTLRER